MIERAHLAIIQLIGEEKTLTQAADELCLTQSALSHSIKKLEHSIGVPVWRKEGRTLHLTEAGKQIYSLAKRLLPQFEHTEALLADIAEGKRGQLRIGMECHPCFQWLLKVISPYLQVWPDVDLDVKQKFQFGGIGALFNFDIDLLVTPDPLHKSGLAVIPIFDYEQKLVVATQHPLATEEFIEPDQLNTETLISYPVEKERLDIYQHFLLPAQTTPAKHQTIETTDIMLRMVAAGRGVAAMPDWLIAEYSEKLSIKAVRLGKTGIQKQLSICIRKDDLTIDYLQSFVEMAKSPVRLE